jgi:polysaccharide pyruvyl transferase WcaK-like protein
MPSSLRLLVIADAGGEEARHIGDEAMLEANLDGFRRLIPGVAVTVVSRDPAWTAARYGVDAVPLFGFPRDPATAAERRAMLDRFLADAGRRDAVAGADAVVVSGGGNLSSTWPDLLYERVGLLQLARILGKPSVVLGQTIGPRLHGDERRLLAEALASARFVGVRELPSAALALGLGIPPERVWYQCDDAMSLEPAPVPHLSAAQKIAVTIDPQVRAAGEALFGSLVRQLRELSETTGAALMLIPHAFGKEPSDLTEARVLAERIGVPQTVIASGLDARQARGLAGDAALVISSRYHPIVFGLVAGVPSLGIYGDDYCRIKVQGALTHARLEHLGLSYDDVAAGALLKTSLDLWTMRQSIRNGLDARIDSWRAECRERWTAVHNALMGDSAPIPPSTLFGRPADEVMPALASAFSAQRRWSEVVLASREARHRRMQLHLQAELGPRRTFVRYVSALRTRLGWK